MPCSSPIFSASSSSTVRRCSAARFTELDERDAFEAIVTVLEAAVAAGRMSIDDPPTMARLLLGLATRGAMLIANSAQPVETSQSVARSIRALLTGLSTPAG